MPVYLSTGERNRAVAHGVAAAARIPPGHSHVALAAGGAAAEAAAAGPEARPPTAGAGPAVTTRHLHQTGEGGSVPPAETSSGSRRPEAVVGQDLPGPAWHLATGRTV